jgi:hypothetical protein
LRRLDQENPIPPPAIKSGQRVSNPDIQEIDVHGEVEEVRLGGRKSELPNLEFDLTPLEEWMRAVVHQLVEQEVRGIVEEVLREKFRGLLGK